MIRTLVCIFVALVSARASAADVSPNGFLVRTELTIAAPASKVYDALTRQVGAWWNPQHTYSGDSANLSIDLRPGGCFCEKLANGGVEHLRVIQLRQNQLLRMSGDWGHCRLRGSPDR
jgi:uncharacterized protein YndB with AHSA1/START domain